MNIAEKRTISLSCNAQICPTGCERVLSGSPPPRQPKQGYPVDKKTPAAAKTGKTRLVWCFFSLI
jgi:hypothetical protein